MNKKNNKGFTLVEVIIAISIFSIVIAMGYQVINRINTDMVKNKVTHENQISVNLINKYITKDLEKSINFNRDYSKKVTENEYSFVIEVSNYKENNNDIKYIEYKVNLTNEKLNYNVTRRTYKGAYLLENKASEIMLIENQRTTNSDMPFVIERYEEGTDSQGNKLYKDTYSVKLYSGKGKRYSFDVSSRMLESSAIVTPPTGEKDEGEIDIPSIIIKPTPPDGIDLSLGLGYSGFLVANPNYKSNNNIYTWMNSTINNKLFDKYGTQNEISKGIEVSGSLQPGNASANDTTKIGSNTVLTIDKRDKKYFPNIGKPKYFIYVSQGIIFKNKGILGGGNNAGCTHPTLQSGTHYHSGMQTNNKIEINGNIKLLDGYDYGYIIIGYGI